MKFKSLLQNEQANLSGSNAWREFTGRARFTGLRKRYDFLFRKTWRLGATLHRARRLCMLCLRRHCSLPVSGSHFGHARNIWNFFIMTQFLTVSVTLDVTPVTPWRLKDGEPLFSNKVFWMNEWMLVAVIWWHDTLACLRAKLLPSCPPVCDPVDCGPPGSSVLGILQGRTLEGAAMASSRGASWPRDGTQVSCVADSLPLTHRGGFIIHLIDRSLLQTLLLQALGSQNICVIPFRVKDGEAWRATVHGVAKRQTRPSDRTTTVYCGEVWKPNPQHYYQGLPAVSKGNLRSQTEKDIYVAYTWKLQHHANEWLYENREWLEDIESSRLAAKWEKCRTGTVRQSTLGYFSTSSFFFFFLVTHEMETKL